MASLPIVTSGASQQWTCQACGICCRGSLVPLSDADLRRLEKQHWERHDDYQDTPVTVPHGGGRRLAHREDGSCVFLQDDGLCLIHAEHGYDAKPTACRVFPLQLAPQRDQAQLTLRSACPTASQNQGEPLDSYLPQIKELAKKGELHPDPIKPPLLLPRRWHDWDIVEPVLESVAKQLTDERFPLVRRIAHVCQFADRLQAGVHKEIQAKELAAKLPKWEQASEEASSVFFQHRNKPSRAISVLFRLVALEHLRLLPSHVTREGWSQRIALVKAALRMTWGGGRVPTLGCDLPAAAFADLEKPRGRTSIDVLAPLTHMFETTARSYLYATANRGGWSVVESIRAFALTMPVGMWLLRWLALNREATPDDVATIVVALDRGQGHAGLSGSQHRWRVKTIHQLGGIESLAAWYIK